MSVCSCLLGAEVFLFYTQVRPGVWENLDTRCVLGFNLCSGLGRRVRSSQAPLKGEESGPVDRDGFERETKTWIIWRGIV